MKKIIVTIFIITSMICAVGCSNTDNATENPNVENTDNKTDSGNSLKSKFTKQELYGEWTGIVEVNDEENAGEFMPVFLCINEDGSWMSSYSGSRHDGVWNDMSSSGRMLSLLNKDSEEEAERDNGWTFGKLDDNYVFGFNKMSHYEAVVEKADPIAEDELFGDWYVQTESKSLQIKSQG